MNAAYIVAAAFIAGAVTFALRVVPFAMLRPLRESAVVARLAAWMPAGVLTVLAIVMFLDAAGLRPGEPIEPRRALYALVASAVTALVHLLGGRRTLLSIGAGTLCYVCLVNLF